MKAAKEIWQKAFVFYGRILLGILFVLASLGKVTDLRSFAVIVSDYRLLPQALTLPFAASLAWTELLCGVWLIFGRRIWIGGALAGALFAVFLFGTGISLARGLEIDCGCFNFPLFGPPKIGWHVILRNLILLAVSLMIFHLDRKSRRAAAGGPA